MEPDDQLARASGFDWDAGNAAKNWLRHGVTQAECEQVFLNVPLTVANDEKHSSTETRYFALGQTDLHHLLFVVFTFRSETVRVISARDMSTKERAIYARLADEPVNEED